MGTALHCLTKCARTPGDIASPLGSPVARCFPWLKPCGYLRKDTGCADTQESRTLGSIPSSKRADGVRSPNVRLGCCGREVTALRVASHLAEGTVLVQVSKNFRLNTDSKLQHADSAQGRENIISCGHRERGQKKGQTRMSVPRYCRIEWPYSAFFSLEPRPSCCAEGAPLLEALATKNWTPLRGAERDCRFLSTLRARRFCFRAHLRGASASAAFSALGFTAFAPFRFVLETFVGEKHLFAGSKNKFSAALRTLQHPVVVFHEPLSPCPSQVGGWAHFALRTKSCGETCSPGVPGWGPLGLRTRSCNRNPTSLPNRGLNHGSAALNAAIAEVSPLPAAASCAVASAKGLLSRGASRRASCRSCAS